VTRESLFEGLLASSVAAHGHFCPGQVVGVRMALLGCRLAGFSVPLGDEQIKKIIVFVEMDRCAGDAIAHVTGVRLGRRSLKHADYGIMAATFINLETGQAFRVISTEEARDLTPLYAPEVTGRQGQQGAAYRVMPDGVLFRVERVVVDLSQNDLPGPTKCKTSCARCGQVVRDGREIIVDGQPLCQPCAGGAYFREAREMNWPEMDWSPVKPPIPSPSPLASGSRPQIIEREGA